MFIAINNFTQEFVYPDKHFYICKKINRLWKSVSIDRVTLLKYLKCLDEAKLIRCLYTELDKITDLQKPDKLLMDNTNLLYTFSETEPEKGTVRETFFCNQLSSAGHVVEYEASRPVISG